MHLHEMGWTAFFEAAFPADPGTEPARVAEEHRGLYQVWTESGEVSAHLSGRYRHRHADAHEEYPAVGDWVVLSQDGVIVGVLPRLTALKRKRAFRQTAAQVIASNVDTVFIVTSLNADFNPRRIERYLTLVWDSGARPVLVLSKSDLCDDPEARLGHAGDLAAAVAVHALSALEGEGIEQLAEYLGAGRTIALVGSSGVGKSTLINTLAGEKLQVVKEIRRDAYRGQHTTTSRQLLRLPNGALVIDTPGMRELGLQGDSTGVGSTFGDIEELATQCRFRDCGHRTEPGCAILSALHRGELDEDRWRSYGKLQREVSYLEKKSRSR